MNSVQLRDIAEIERHGVDPANVDAETPYVGLDAIEPDGSISGLTTAGEADLASTKFRFSDRHILFAKLRPYLRKVARPNFAGICSTDIIPIAPSSRVDRNYLFHYLRTDAVIDRATSMSSGANLPRISPTLLAKFEVPLPPLDKQRRIAAILDQADALRQKQQQALCRLMELKFAKFESCFGDPAVNPREWPECTIGDIAESTQYGTSERAGAAGSYPILRMNNLTYEGELHTTNLKYIDIKPRDTAKFLVRDGDVLFNRTNSPELVGKTANPKNADPKFGVQVAGPVEQRSRLRAP